MGIQDPKPGAREAVLANIRGRRSVRRYLPREVPKEVILEVLDAARWAPSAVNRQPWRYVVVTRAELRQELCRRAGPGPLRWRHLAEAPVVIAVLADPAAGRWHLIDCAFAGQNLMLAAHALGLGSCWIGAFREAAVRGTLGVPDRLKVAGLVTLGYPAEPSPAPPRLPLEDLVSWERYRRGPRVARRLTRTGILSLARRRR